MSDKNEYMYTVWFRDNNVNSTDQDFEFPVSIIITASSRLLAKEWGDKISKKYAEHNLGIQLLNSEITTIDDYKDCELDNVPIIHYGYEPSDEEIGL